VFFVVWEPGAVAYYGLISVFFSYLGNGVWGWCTHIHDASKGVWSLISHFGLMTAPVHISPLFTSDVQDSIPPESSLPGARLRC
jgi:hypothetical protein